MRVCRYRLCVFKNRECHPMSAPGVFRRSLLLAWCCAHFTTSCACAPAPAAAFADTPGACTSSIEQAPEGGDALLQVKSIRKVVQSAVRQNAGLRQVVNQTCAPESLIEGEYTDIDEARDACYAITSCAAIFGQCVGGNKFSLCKDGYGLVQPDAGYCLFTMTKPGETGLAAPQQVWAQQTMSSADTTIGKESSLDEKGFQEVLAAGCSMEMEFFIRRLIISLNLELCHEAGLLGLLPWYTNETSSQNAENQNFATLEENLKGSSYPKDCAFLAPPGSCAELGPSCAELGSPNPESHRRRLCAVKPTLDPQ
mmetsp:Transcript_126468/g.205492  ORF Transcript_126468/g.205492 Transcript_126468/m.205492 type:complete len:311 (+) Transcript_126468:1-933(+)